MAAVLCRGLCAPCEFCCKACGGCMRATEKCCGRVFDFLDDLFKRPMSCCLTFTLLLCAAPGVVGVVMGLAHLSNNCNTPLHVWSILAGLNFFGHVIMALYMFQRFSDPYDRSNPNDRDFVARLGHMLCEDCGVAVYILFLIWVIVWQVIGGVWLGDAAPSDAGSTCNDSLEKACYAVLVIMWVYLGVGGFFFIVDFTCKVCKYRICSGCESGDCACCFKLCCPCCFPTDRRHRQSRSHGASAQAHVNHPVEPNAGYYSSHPQPPAAPAQQHYGGSPSFASPNPQPQYPPQPAPQAYGQSHPAVQQPYPQQPYSQQPYPQQQAHPAAYSQPAPSAPPASASAPPAPQEEQGSGEPESVAERMGRGVASGISSVKNWWKRR